MARRRSALRTGHSHLDRSPPPSPPPALRSASTATHRCRLRSALSRAHVRRRAQEGVLASFLDSTSRCLCLHGGANIYFLCLFEISNEDGLHLIGVHLPGPLSMHQCRARAWSAMCMSVIFGLPVPAVCGSRVAGPASKMKIRAAGRSHPSITTYTCLPLRATWAPPPSS